MAGFVLILETSDLTSFLENIYQKHSHQLEIDGYSTMIHVDLYHWLWQNLLKLKDYRSHFPFQKVH